MRARFVGGFSVTWVPNLLIPPVVIGIFDPNGQIWSKICIFGHFGPNVGIFGPFRPVSYQKTMQTRCLSGFSVMWVPKLLLSPVKIRMFCPKPTKFGAILVFLVILDQALPAHW